MGKKFNLLNKQINLNYNKIIQMRYHFAFIKLTNILHKPQHKQKYGDVGILRYYYKGAYWDSLTGGPPSQASHNPSGSPFACLCNEGEDLKGLFTLNWL